LIKILSSYERTILKNADKNLSAVVHFSAEYLSGLTFKPQKINHVALSVELMMQM